MVQSMTGYGAATRVTDNYKVTVELKSLNRKYVEINMKLPRAYMQKELEIRNHLTKKLGRGKINTVLNVDVLNPDKHNLGINIPVVKAYAAELEKLRKELGLESQVSMEYLLGLQDAIRSDAETADPEEWALIEEAFKEATEKLYESRHKEGQALEEDMRTCIRLIGEQIVEIKSRMPQRIRNVRSRLDVAVQEVRDRAQMDGNRFEQELIYYIEKLDINEEIVRLEKHIKYFGQTLSDKGGSGKKLGFIAQEMGREINTIGSKANDAEIQVFVVKMKEELEKIKEQVQNVA